MMPKVPAGSKIKFRKFLDNYLIKFYFFSHIATFPIIRYDINDFEKFNMSTNSAEVINPKLKVLAGNGNFFPNRLSQIKKI